MELLRRYYEGQMANVMSDSEDEEDRDAQRGRGANGSGAGPSGAGGRPDLQGEKNQTTLGLGLGPCPCRLWSARTSPRKYGLGRGTPSTVPRRHPPLLPCTSNSVYSSHCLYLQAACWTSSWRRC